MLKKVKLLGLTSLALILFAGCGGRLVDQPGVNPPAPEPTPVQPTPDPNITPTPAPNPNPVVGDVVDLKILTLNIWGLPNPITKDLKKRLALIPNVISGYDIVNLQETFSDNANIILEKANYPFKFRMDNGNLIKLNSGLTTLSKYPIVSRRFVSFSNCAGTDCMANKGILFLRLNIPQIGDVDLYNTHYQAIESKEDIRVEDNKEFEAFLKRNEVGNPTIMTGDFNFTNYDGTDSTSKAFMDFKSRFNPLDTYRIANPQIVGFTHDTRINKYGDKEERPQRLDYIFVLPENRGVNNQRLDYKVEVLESKVVFTEPVNSYFVSDHFGVATTVRIHLGTQAAAASRYQRRNYPAPQPVFASKW